MSDLERVAVLESEIEAQLLRAALEERSIPHLIRSYHDSAYDGLFQAVKGWGAVEAPSEFKEEIIAILDDLRTSTDWTPLSESPSE